MDQWTKLNAQSDGKDKLARLIQYSTRFLWYTFEKQNDSQVIIAKLKIIEDILSNFRKMLRFGKSLDVFYGTLKTIHLQDSVLRLLLTFSRIHQSLFLLFDHFLWLTKIGLLKSNIRKCSEYSNRFWLYSIIMNLARDFYEIIRILKSKLKYGTYNIPCSLARKYSFVNAMCQNIPISKPVFIFLEMHPDIFWDTVKNICDIWLPLTALGHSKLSPGAVGLLGSISTIAGIVALLDPLSKLSPS